MSKPFLTGSRVYGTPRADSDIDLVVLVTPEELDKLALFADVKMEEMAPFEDRYGGDAEIRRSLRFGKLNMICVCEDQEYHVWKDGTALLAEKKKKTGPVTREEAVRLFEHLRHDDVDAGRGY